MNLKKATLPQLNSDQCLTILEQIKLDDETKFIGWRVDNLKKIDKDWIDDKGNTQYFYYTVESSVYDKTTQKIIEKQQLKDNVSNLQTLLAQSTANNAQSSVDVENLKQQNAQLVQQIAQLQVQGGSTNG